MTHSRKDKIAEKLWLYDAKKYRLDMKNELEQMPSHQFCDNQATLSFGRCFWKKAENCSYDEPRNLTKVLESMNSSKTEALVYWLHRNSHDTGMIKAKLSEIISIINKNQTYHEDILIADTECTYGVCFEVGEYESWLRHWGI